MFVLIYYNKIMTKLKILKHVDLYSDKTIKELFCPQQSNIVTDYMVVESIFHYPLTSNKYP